MVEDREVVRRSFDDVSPTLVFDRVPPGRDPAWLRPAAARNAARAWPRGWASRAGSAPPVPAALLPPWAAWAFNPIGWGLR